MNTGTVTVERDLDVSPAELWKALTDVDIMRKWYFDLNEFRAEAGFEFRFYGGTEENQYLHICKIVEASPNTRLAYSWRYDGHAGNSLVSFDIEETQNGCKLTVTHSGLDTFPSDIPDFAQHNFDAGWKEIIGVSLPGLFQSEAGLN